MKDGLGSALRVLPDHETMSRAAAELIVEIARAAMARRSRFAAALSGGATPKRLYELLAAAPFRDRMPWGFTHVFWADERCVPRDHPDSNYRLVSDALLSRVSLPAENIHRIRGEEGPVQAALAYEQELARFFGQAGFPVFDLIVLGAGADGHTASLFPSLSALSERKRLAVEVIEPDIRHARVTLTLPVLNNAVHALILASGAGKASVIEEIFEHGNARQYPAGLVQPARGTLFWFVDRATYKIGLRQ